MFDAMVAEPAINVNCGVSRRRVKIARAAPLKDLLTSEFVATNKVDHPREPLLVPIPNNEAART